eukprot:2902881-Rhodomonas_salina.1
MSRIDINNITNANDAVACMCFGKMGEMFPYSENYQNYRAGGLTYPLKGVMGDTVNVVNKILEDKLKEVYKEESVKFAAMEDAKLEYERSFSNWQKAQTRLLDDDAVLLKQIVEQDLFCWTVNTLDYVEVFTRHGVSKGDISERDMEKVRVLLGMYKDMCPTLSWCHARFGLPVVTLA